MSVQVMLLLALCLRINVSVNGVENITDHQMYKSGNLLFFISCTAAVAVDWPVLNQCKHAVSLHERFCDVLPKMLKNVSV